MDSDAVKCPDCGLGEIKPGDRCDACGLSWEDLEAAGEFFDRLVEARQED